MALSVSAASPASVTAEWESKANKNIARKSGMKHVHGKVFTPKNRKQLFMEWMSCGRGPKMIDKAAFESNQYCQAAVLRKNREAQKVAEKRGTPLTDEEYDQHVWNSNGVQARINREDNIRYNEVFSKRSGTGTRNRIARKLSRVGHHLHGVCEVMSAPTGFTSSTARNAISPGMEDQSTKNKFFMFATLGFVGVAFTELIQVIKRTSGEGAKHAGASVGGALYAFPVASGAFGLLGTVAGIFSQAVVKKQDLTVKQKEVLNNDLNLNSHRLLQKLLSIKGDAESISIVGKAMQGRHWTKKIGSAFLDSNGIPVILNNALAAIDPANSKQANIEAMHNALGDYLQVEKPEGENRTLWNRYCFKKAVMTRESHFVALVSLVDHADIAARNEKGQEDGRKCLERKVGNHLLHDGLLKAVALPASLVDKVTGTKMAETLRKWASDDYRKLHAKKINDPARAHKNRNSGEYMAKNLHQYGPITRNLVKLAETMRLINMNVILASNGNLSAGFRKMFQGIHNLVGTSPASRSMTYSMGRLFGGAVLATLFGVVVPVAADASGAGYSTDIGSFAGEKPTLNATNIGILMFLLSVPTFAVQGLAHIAARAEGWKGNLEKPLKHGAQAYALK